MKKDVLRILLATFVSWTGLRLTEVALPLITLQQTGSTWATGLVAGSAGLSLLTSPWWSARLRHRLTSGPALAAILCVQSLGYVTVAVAATLDSLSVVHLCLCGLVAGAATSVGGPATRAMLADLGDRIGPGVAVRALAWQDLAHRVSMVAGPPVAAWVVTQHGAMPLMWADTIAVLLAAVLVARVGRYALRQGSTGAVPRRAREVLRAHPVVGYGIAMAALGWFWWFAFALGLAILGAETGRPGQLVAAGMSGYGIGSLAGSVSAPLLVTRLPRVPTMVVGWMVLGATFMALPWVEGSLLALALVSAVGGFVVPFGLAALNAVIAEQTSGEERRTAFVAQHVAGSGGASVGMLTGGAVIALVGAETTMHVAGVVLIAVPLVLVARTRLPRRRQDSNQPPPAASGIGRSSAAPSPPTTCCTRTSSPSSTPFSQQQAPVSRHGARGTLGWRLRRRERTALQVAPGDVPPAPRLVAGPEPSLGPRTPLLVPPTDRAPGPAR